MSLTTEQREEMRAIVEAQLSAKEEALNTLLTKCKTDELKEVFKNDIEELKSDINALHDELTIY